MFDDQTYRLNQTSSEVTNPISGQITNTVRYKSQREKTQVHNLSVSRHHQCYKALFADSDKSPSTEAEALASSSKGRDDSTGRLGPCPWTEKCQSNYFLDCNEHVQKRDEVMTYSVMTLYSTSIGHGSSIGQRSSTYDFVQHVAFMIPIRIEILYKEKNPVHGGHPTYADANA